MSMGSVSKVVKFCSSRYNLAQEASTIRLGTFEYYRAIECETTRDEAEGKETIEVEWLDSGEASEADLQNIRAVKFGSTAEHRMFKNCTFGNDFPNSYVFCTTHTWPDDLDKYGKELDPGYDSHYFIDDLNAFATRTARLLAENLTFNNFFPQVKDKLNSLPLVEQVLQVRFVHNPVTYVIDKNGHIENSKLSIEAKNVDPSLRPAFTKPKKYENNYEYRFLFYVFHPRIGVLAVKTEPVDLPLSAYANVVSLGTNK